MNVQDFSTLVANDLKKDENPQLDILTIIMIAKIIYSLIQMIQDCNEKQDVAEIVNAQTRHQKFVAIKKIKENLPFGQKVLAKRIFSGIISQAQCCESKDLQKLLDK